MKHTDLQRNPLARLPPAKSSLSLTMSRTTHRAVCLFGLTLGCLLLLDFAGGQPVPSGGKWDNQKWKDKGAAAPDPEARAIFKTAERAVKGGGETEREKWLDELKRVFR